MPPVLGNAQLLPALALREPAAACKWGGLRRPGKREESRDGGTEPRGWALLLRGLLSILKGALEKAVAHMPHKGPDRTDVLNTSRLAIIREAEERDGRLRKGPGC